MGSWLEACTTCCTPAPFRRYRIPQTTYTPEEIGRIGTAIYRRQLRPQVMPHCKDQFLILDIESGDYEIDADDTSAEERLRARRGIVRATDWLHVSLYPVGTDERGRPVRKWGQIYLPRREGSMRIVEENREKIGVGVGFLASMQSPRFSVAHMACYLAL